MPESLTQNDDIPTIKKFQRSVRRIILFLRLGALKVKVPTSAAEKREVRINKAFVNFFTNKINWACADSESEFE